MDYCCENCFSNLEIKAVVNHSKLQRGDCSFCNSIDVNICEVTSNDSLKTIFEELLDVYAPVKNSDERNTDLLRNIMKNHWDIFKLNANGIQRFLVSLFPEKYEEQPDLFDLTVAISGISNPEYLEQYSLLGNYQWEDFVKEIKEKSRFHTDVIKKKILLRILQNIRKEYNPGEIFYRARICNENRSYINEEMGAPPPGKASSGRANPEGISCLYLGDSVDTTLHETRAGVYDKASVAKFKLLKKIEVVNLAEIDKISPFRADDIHLLPINQATLKKIGFEISRPLRRYDSSIDYLPTQYICDFIKSEGYDGIEYESTMSKTGVNLAVFDEELFECIDTTTYDINDLDYSYVKSK